MVAIDPDQGVRRRLRAARGLRGDLDLHEVLRDLGSGEQLAGEVLPYSAGLASSCSSAGAAIAALPLSGATWAWLLRSLCASST